MCSACPTISPPKAAPNRLPDLPPAAERVLGGRGKMYFAAEGMFCTDLDGSGREALITSLPWPQDTAPGMQRWLRARRFDKPGLEPSFSRSCGMMAAILQIPVGAVPGRGHAETGFDRHTRLRRFPLRVRSAPARGHKRCRILIRELADCLTPEPKRLLTPGIASRGHRARRKQTSRSAGPTSPTRQLSKSTLAMHGVESLPRRHKGLKPVT